MKVDFTVPFTDLKGKSHEILRAMSQDENITDDMEIRTVDSDAKTKVRVEVVKTTMADLVSNCLVAPEFNKNMKRKKKFLRAKLAEKIALADEAIEISIPQAQDIIAAVNGISNPLELMRVCELVDPTNELIGDDD